MELKIFGDAIKQIRIGLGLSQEKLAEYTGLHRTYISDVERGTRNITLKNILRLSVALQKKPSSLLECLDGIDISKFSSQILKR